VAAQPVRLRANVEESLWPLVETFLGAHEVAGLAVAVMREGEVVSRGFGVRDVGTGAPVTPETMFHLASVSKPFVATAIVSLASAREAGEPLLDLDAPIVELVPEFTLADGRAREVTARGLLSHSSGLPDVSDYGWHDPQLGDDALSQFARSLSGWRLQAQSGESGEPGSAFSYSNAGFELLGLLLSRATGTTFEDAVRQQVLSPLGMRNSTFLRGEVPTSLAASPHVGMPLQVPEGSYPYTRRHAPSSTLHSNLVEMCRWMDAHLGRGEESPGGSDDERVRLDAGLLDLMWRPVVKVGEPPWEEAASLGWFVGSHRGLRMLSHSGADPGFGSKLALLPERRTGVVVLANSNTVPTSAIAAAALDIALADGSPSVVSGELGEGLVAMRAMLPSVVGPVAEILATSGPDAAAAAFHRLAAAAASGPAEFDIDDEGFSDAVWGAIELHRTGMVWPLLRLWTALRPDSSAAWTMTGWAEQVDGHLDQARSLLRRAIDLDPENDDAALIMSNLPSA
jgi:CubicO group peptidase (beta-lactamase class C family)